MNTFSGKPDQGSEANLNRIESAINYIIAKGAAEPGKIHACKIQTGYIKPDFAIVGFNKDGEKNAAGKTGTKGNKDYGYVEESCHSQDVYKPSNCLGFACICLCDGGTGDITSNDCKSDEAKCVRLPASITQLYSWPAEGIKDMVFYGERCSGGDKNVITGYYLELSTQSILQISEIQTYEEYISGKYRDLPLCQDLLKPKVEKKEETARDESTPKIEAQ